jgi:hypothetical protein
MDDDGGAEKRPRDLDAEAYVEVLKAKREKIESGLKGTRETLVISNAKHRRVRVWAHTVAYPWVPRRDHCYPGAVRARIHALVMLWRRPGTLLNLLPRDILYHIIIPSIAAYILADHEFLTMDKWRVTLGVFRGGDRSTWQGCITSQTQLCVDPSAIVHVPVAGTFTFQNGSPGGTLAVTHSDPLCGIGSVAVYWSTTPHTYHKGVSPDYWREGDFFGLFIRDRSGHPIRPRVATKAEDFPVSRESGSYHTDPKLWELVLATYGECL